MLGLGYGCWGPLIAVFVCPDSFPVVHLVEGSQPVCMLGVAVYYGQCNLACCGLWCWSELLAHNWLFLSFRMTFEIYGIFKG